MKNLETYLLLFYTQIAFNHPDFYYVLISFMTMDPVTRHNDEL